MTWLLGFAIALTRSWAATYTRGLPPDVRAERREEIDCDLWHHQRLADLERQPVTGTAMEVLARWLAGIPSDITWRIEAGAAQPKGITPMNETLPMRVGYVAAMFLLLLVATAGISFLVGNGDWDNTWEHWTWRAAFVALPVIGAVGLWLCATRRALGFAMVLVGVGISAFLMPWMAFVTVPFGLAIIVFAVFRSGYLPRSPSRRQPA